MSSFGNTGRDEDGERLGNVLDAMFCDVEAVVCEMAAEHRTPLAATFEHVVDRRLQSLQAQKPVIKAKDLKLWRAKFQTLVAAKSDRKLCRGDLALARKAKALAWRLLSNDVFSPDHSGVVIGGFGARQQFPALVAYNIEGFLGGVFKCHQTHDEDLNSDPTPTLLPFAQTSMLEAFVTGVDQHAANHHAASVVNELQSCFNYCVRNIAMDASQLSALRARFSRAVTNLARRHADYNESRHRPIERELTELTTPSLRPSRRPLSN